MTEIRLERLSKSFGNKVVIEAVELTINAGEIFFLLGPSGCGKSTLLRLIAGLHEPSSGRIFFNGRDVTDLSTDKRNAAMCFQSYALWPHMTVRANIRFGLDVRKIADAEAKRRVDEAIDLVQLQAHADKKPNELSGGQQQRVALARALVVRPDCLLLDEPLSNLDAKLRLEMRTEIRRICRASKLTAIYVTHDQKEALSIADRMAVLNLGKIEQLGAPQELYRRPANAFVANFMGETNFIRGEVAGTTADAAVRVQTALGEVLAANIGGPRWPDGSAVTLSVRPETILVDPASLANESLPNIYHGVVRDTVYLGEVAQHVVQLNGVELLAFELNPRVVAHDGERQPATIRFDPADVVIFPS